MVLGGSVRFVVLSGSRLSNCAVQFKYTISTDPKANRKSIAHCRNDLENGFAVQLILAQCCQLVDLPREPLGSWIIR